MAEKREINPLMKTGLELGPVIAFFIVGHNAIQPKQITYVALTHCHALTLCTQ